MDNSWDARCSLGAPLSYELGWQEADAQMLPFPDLIFDRVICQLSLQDFPDRLAAMGEMHRVLHPGGRAVGLVWHDLNHSPGYVALVNALEIHARTGGGHHNAGTVRIQG